MTLAAMISKSAIVLIITPMIAFELNSEDIVVWFLYLSAISLVRMLDFGLSPTFIRVTSYLQTDTNNSEISNKISGLSFKDVYLFTQSKFLKMAKIGIFLGFTIGTLLVYKPIMSSSNPHWFFLGWAIIVLLSSYSVYSNYILCFCLGTEDVAKVQKIQVKSNLFAGLLSTISFLIFKDIVITASLYLISFPISVFELKRKFLIDFKGRCEKSSLSILDGLTQKQSIKSGLGLLLSTGLIEFSGVIGANILVSSSASKYQFGLQLIRSVNGFSHAPFTSKIPKMSKLFAVNDFNGVVSQSRKSMKNSYLLFFIGYSIIFFGILFSDYLNFKLDNIPSLDLWAVLGLCFLVERLGSLHIQLYSITNNIIWHKANAASGFVTVLLCIIFYNVPDMIPQYIFPISMTLAYLLTYVPISLFYSSQYFKFNPFTFEIGISVPYFILIMLYFILFVDV